MAGKPDGTEKQATEEAQARAQTLSDELKMQKESNAKLREGILEAINELVSCVQILRDKFVAIQMRCMAGEQWFHAQNFTCDRYQYTTTWEIWRPRQLLACKVLKQLRQRISPWTLRTSW